VNARASRASGRFSQASTSTATSAATAMRRPPASAAGKASVLKCRNSGVVDQTSTTTA
jgi:hypothetical protein